MKCVDFQYSSLQQLSLFSSLYLFLMPCPLSLPYIQYVVFCMLVHFIGWLDEVGLFADYLLFPFPFAILPFISIVYPTGLIILSPKYRVYACMYVCMCVCGLGLLEVFTWARMAGLGREGGGTCLMVRQKQIANNKRQVGREKDREKERRKERKNKNGHNKERSK